MTIITCTFNICNPWTVCILALVTLPTTVQCNNELNVNFLDEAEERYLRDTTKNHGITMNSRALLLICTALCFVVFFYCCLRLVITVTYESSIDQGTAESAPDAMREAILSNLSVFQRRAILEIFFRNEIFSCSRAKKNSNFRMEGKKLHDNDNDHDDSDDDDVHVVDHEVGGALSNNGTMGKDPVGTPKAAPFPRKNIDDDKGQCFGTPSTQQSLSPENYKDLKVYDSSSRTDSCCVKLSMVPLRNRGEMFATRSNSSDSTMVDIMRHDLYLGPIPTKLKFPIACGGSVNVDMDDHEEQIQDNQIDHEDHGLFDSDALSMNVSETVSEERDGKAMVMNSTGSICGDGSGEENRSWEPQSLLTNDCNNQDIQNNDEKVATPAVASAMVSRSVDDDQSKSEMDVVEDGNICSICLDGYEEGDSVAKSKHCTHFFHRECIIQWLEREKSDYKCPCCRNHMVTTDELREAASCINSENTTIGNNQCTNHTNSSNDRGEAIRSHFGIGRIMSGYRPPPPSSTASPRRRTYSDESPIFVPDV